MNNSSITIDLSQVFLPHFLEVLPYILKINEKLRNKLDDGTIDWEKIPIIEKFIFKSARLVGKTEFVVRLQILLMYLDNRISWIAIMKTKKEGGDKLMGKYRKAIMEFSRIIPGFEHLFKTSPNPVQPLIQKLNGDWKQEILFVNYDDCEKAGASPKNPNTFYAGWFGEEFMSSSEKNSLNPDVTNRIISSLDQLTISIKRDLPKDVHGLINFILMNPWQGSSPILESFNKYNPDNLEHMRKYGWKSYVNAELSEYYATGSLIINPYVIGNSKLLVDIETKKKIDIEEYNLLKYGINGNPSNFPLTQVWNNNIVEQQHIINGLDRTKNFVAFRIGIDVSRGSAETAVELVGVYLNKFEKDKSFITVLDEMTFNPKERKHQPDVWAEEILWKINEWYTTYQFITEEVKIKVDGANKDFIDIMQKTQAMIIAKYLNKKNFDCYLDRFKIEPFSVSAKTNWETGIRIGEWKIGIALGKIKLSNVWSPKLFLQVPLQNYKTSGNREDGFDDSINAFEYAAYTELKSITRWYRTNDLKKIDS